MSFAAVRYFLFLPLPTPFGIHPLRKYDRQDDSFMNECNAYTYILLLRMCDGIGRLRRWPEEQRCCRARFAARRLLCKLDLITIARDTAAETFPCHSYLLYVTVQVCCDFRWADMVNGKLVIWCTGISERRRRRDGKKEFLHYIPTATFGYACWTCREGRYSCHGQDRILRGWSPGRAFWKKNR